MELPAPSRHTVLGPSGRGTVGADIKGATLWSNAPRTKVQGGVREGRTRTREGSDLSVPCRGSESGGKHLDPSEVVSLRGATMDVDLRPYRPRGAGASSPLANAVR